MIEPIDVRETLARPGSSATHRVHVSIEGLGTEVARISDDVPVGADLLFESLVEGILVSGTLRGTMAFRCARCLRGFDGPFDVEVHEMFVAEPAADTDDYPLDPEGSVDLEQMIRDAIGVELPFSPLCHEGCLGLCPVCGADRNGGECPGHVETDPRWAVLDQLAPMLDDN